MTKKLSILPGKFFVNLFILTFVTQFDLLVSKICTQAILKSRNLASTFYTALKYSVKHWSQIQVPVLTSMLFLFYLTIWIKKIIASHKNRQILY